MRWYHNIKIPFCYYVLGRVYYRRKEFLFLLKILSYLFSIFKHDQILSISVIREKDDTLVAHITTIPADTDCPCCGAPGSKNGHARPKVILSLCSAVKSLKNFSSTTLPVPSPTQTTWFVS